MADDFLKSAGFVLYVAVVLLFDLYRCGLVEQEREWGQFEVFNQLFANIWRQTKHK